MTPETIRTTVGAFHPFRIAAIDPQHTAQTSPPSRRIIPARRDNPGRHAAQCRTIEQTFASAPRRVASPLHMATPKTTDTAVRQLWCVRPLMHAMRMVSGLLLLEISQCHTGQVTRPSASLESRR